MDWKTYISTFVRQGVTSLGAVLVAKGVLSPELVTSFTDSTTALIAGTLVLIAGYVWSLVSKKKALDTSTK